MHGFRRKPKLSEVGGEPSSELRRCPPATAATAAASRVRRCCRRRSDASMSTEGTVGVTGLLIQAVPRRLV